MWPQLSFPEVKSKTSLVSPERAISYKYYPSSLAVKSGDPSGKVSSSVFIDLSVKGDFCTSSPVLLHLPCCCESRNRAAPGWVQEQLLSRQDIRWDIWSSRGVTGSFPRLFLKAGQGNRNCNYILPKNGILGRILQRLSERISLPGHSHVLCRTCC